MKRLIRWINETDASKVNALLGAGGFALTLVVVGLMSLIAFVSHVHYDHAIEVPDVWVRILDSILIATAVWAGVSQAAQIGRRAATKPAVVAAEADAEAKKVIAVAKADVVRRSGAVPVVPDEGETGEGRSGLEVEPDRNVDDEGNRL